MGTIFSLEMGHIKHHAYQSPENTAVYEPKCQKPYLPTWHMCPAKIQIRLCICTVWSESSLGLFRSTKDGKFLHVDNENWSDCANMYFRRYFFDIAFHKAFMLSFSRLSNKDQISKLVYWERRKVVILKTFYDDGEHELPPEWSTKRVKTSYISAIIQCYWCTNIFINPQKKYWCLDKAVDAHIKFIIHQ